MNDLLFYTILIALLYYFFIYLPSQKRISPAKPLTHSPISKTEPTIEPKEILKGPKVVSCPGPQEKEENTELEKELDKLIKNIKELSKEIE